MNIHITLVMHTLVDEPVQLVRSLAGPDTFWHIYVHSTILAVMEAADSLDREDPNVLVEQVGFNRGLSYSWNEGLIASQKYDAEVCMIANDDVIANRYDMHRIAYAALEHSDHYFITGQCLHQAANVYAGTQFALCAITPLALETIGYFDENIFPLYHEDVDWYHRAAIAGLQSYNIGHTDIVHLGQSTFTSNQQAERQIRIAVPRIEQYYLAKWGGPSGHEPFDKPFNDPRFGVKITEADRHAPYPGYNRTDYVEILAIQ